MKRTNPLLGMALVGTAALFAQGESSFQVAAAGAQTFDVTVTNLTSGQIFSPLLVASHGGDVALFRPGMPASPELALLAEEGDNSQLAALLGTTAGVGDVASGAGMILPGQSETVTVMAGGQTDRISLATMLVSTNDTFAALRGVAAPRGAQTAVFYAEGWDAGSEFNSESCAFVPGPPCGAAGAHDPTPAEGYVHISPGIHGIGDLLPEVRDWRNPVAVVTIRRALP